MRRPSWLLVLGATAATLLWAHHAWVRRDVEGRLAAARTAAQTVDYHGVQQVRVEGPSGRVTTTVRITHQAPDLTRYDYLGPDLAGLTILRRGDEVYRDDPHLGTAALAQVGQVESPPSIRGYRVGHGDGALVAGRPTTAVRLGGPGGERRLWLDRDTGLVLRARTASASGVVTDTAFTELALGRPAQAVDFTPPASTAAHTGGLSLERLSAGVGFTVRPPRWAPPGFRLVQAQLAPCPCGCGHNTAHLVYSDGVGWISLFLMSGECRTCTASGEACSACTATDGCITVRGTAVRVVGRVDREPLVVAAGDASERDLARMVAAVP